MRKAWDTVHESVLVGYFCQAVGWLARDVFDESWNQDEAGEKQRLLKAVNLSHNPFDPAIGDLILHLDATKQLPDEFFIYELKVSWDGVADELEKFVRKNDGKEVSQAVVDKLVAEFPRARTAHLFGALKEGKDTSGRPKHILTVAPYWQSLLEREPELKGIIKHLSRVVRGELLGHGMGFDELARYIIRINAAAAKGSRARTGSLRFAVAYKEQELYAFTEQTVLELAKTREACLVYGREEAKRLAATKTRADVGLKPAGR